jgi:UDP-N-acetylmuramate--alanine ligase
VVEADESDGSFLRFGAEAVIVTNVEEDHLDFHGDLAGLETAFDRFVSGAPGPRVLCADDPGAAALAVRTGREACVTYGTDGAADYRIVDLVEGRSGSRFTVVHHGAALASFELHVPGRHNARNAAAVVAMAHQLGVPADAAVRGLAAFGGVRRRFERRGEVGGITFVDDYAHLPTEVAATVQTAAAGGWARVVAVFQPHRYTRTAALADRFDTVFDGADLVVVTGIYAAGQAPIRDVSGRRVADAVRRARPALPVYYAESREEVIARLRDLLQPGDLCLTLNAGDLTTLPDELRPILAGRGSPDGR